MVDFRNATVADRFTTAAAIKRLNSLLGLPADPYRQDWEIEVSDGARLPEFVDHYDQCPLNDDERFALMSLIVASAHDALDSQALDASLWDRIHNLLVRDADLHAYTIHYWCCSDASCDDECFTLTSRMRAVWRSAFGD